MIRRICTQWPPPEAIAMIFRGFFLPMSLTGQPYSQHDKTDPKGDRLQGQRQGGAACLIRRAPLVYRYHG